MVVCRDCLAEKDSSEFYRDSRAKDRLVLRCKLCANARVRTWARADRKSSPGRRYFNYRDGWASDCMTGIRNRKFPCSIDRAYLLALWDRQGGKCAITGHEFNYSPRPDGTNRGPGSLSPSLDLIDNSIGYEDGNLRVVIYCFNSLRRDVNDVEVLRLARLIVTGLDQLALG